MAPLALRPSTKLAPADVPSTVRKLTKCGVPVGMFATPGCRNIRPAPRAGICVDDTAVGVRTEPLTKKDLVNHIAGGCKPESMWRIGGEYEKFGYELECIRPLRYERIVQLLEGMASRYSWDKNIENGMLIGLRKDGKAIALEAGGQVELSGAPLKSLHETANEIDSCFSEMKVVAQEMGIGFLGCGTRPICLPQTIPEVPLDKYFFLLEAYSKTGTTGKDILMNTCSVQVNLDFSSEEDMVRKLRVALALQPIVTALFSNSPFTNGKPNGFLSYRSELYKHFDKQRSGMLPFVFHDNFGFERYVDYALNVPMIYAYRRKRYINCHGMSFKDFMLGRLPNLPGEIATIGDWQNHLMQVYSEVRLKTYLEMRDTDVGSRKQLSAIPALWVGLLYDDISLRAAAQMIENWTCQERHHLRDQVTTFGLKTPFRDSTLKNVAQDVVRLAKEGLERRGLEETRYLDSVLEVAATGTTPAERLLNLYETEWNGNVHKVFGELLC